MEVSEPSAIAPLVEDASGWTFLDVLRLQEVADENVQLTTPVAINGNEFLTTAVSTTFCSETKSLEQYNGILKHNVATNTWTDIVTRDDCRKLGRRDRILPLSHLTAFNPNNNELYLLGGTGTSRGTDILCLFAVNLSTNKHRICCSFSQNSAARGGSVQAENIVVAGDYVHFMVSTIDFSSTMNSSTWTDDSSDEEEEDSASVCYFHLAWNWVTQSDDYVIVWKWNLTNYTQKYGLVYLKQENKILMLGGIESDAIYEFDLDQLEQLDENEIKFRKLYKKQLNLTKGWVERSDVKMPGVWSGFSHVLTQDEKFLILMYGQVGKSKKWMEKMYVLNLKSMQWSKTKQKMYPDNFTFTQFIASTPPLVVMTQQTDVDLLVAGFIRRVEALYVPTVIISIIIKMATVTSIDVLQYLYNPDQANIQSDSGMLRWNRLNLGLTKMRYDLAYHHFRISIESILDSLE